MKIKDSYFLGVGNQDLKRLEILNQIINPGSQRFIKEYIKPNMTILEVGCGIGLMTCWLSQQVGEKGKIIAVDSSEEQLILAQSNATKLNIKNIEFIHADFSQLDYPATFDLCYSRYVMIHLLNPLALLEKYKQCIKNDGIILIEEPILSDMHTHPKTTFWDNIIENYTNISEAKGLDTNFGQNLYTNAEKCQLNILECNAIQSIVSKDISMSYYHAVIDSMGDLFEKNNKPLFDKFKNYQPERDHFLYSRYMSVVQMATQL